MRFNVETDYGKFVRVKTLANGIPYLVTQKPSDWWKENCFWRFRPISYRINNLFEISNIPKDEMFSDLSLGDLVNSPENSYVGQIVSIVVFYNRNIQILDSKAKIAGFYSPSKRRHCYVIAAGIKLYGGFKTELDGTIVGINPLPITNNPEYQIIYQYRDIVYLEKLIQFESIQIGDLIMLKKSKGIVIGLENLNQNNFYNKNSWSNRKITLLGNSKDPFKKHKLTPDKNYLIHRY
jgi:hypothetical protein